MDSYKLFAFLMTVMVTRAAVINKLVPDFEREMTWEDFEEANPVTLPPPTPEKPEEEFDWIMDAVTTEEVDTSDRIGEKTIIAIEFDKDQFESVFLRGGYTGASSFNCGGIAAENPCSIPIRHLIPDGPTGNYSDWAEGDRYLDMMGVEENQGLHDGIEAVGTPMRKMESWAALSRCNSDTSGKQTKTTRDRNKSTFWLVELDMDCSETYGYFEVKVVGKLRNSDKLWYERDIEGKTTNNRAVDESCVGGVGGDIPYVAESHIGFCGKANVFYYKKSYCEVNKIID